MVKDFYSDSMSRSELSSTINSDSSIDINDDDEDSSQSPKREELSSPVVHQNGSVNCNKPSKLSFSISRLLGANSSSNKPNTNPPISEGVSGPQSSLYSQFSSTENRTTNSDPYPSSPELKCQTQRMTLSPYDQLTNASATRLPSHRPAPTLPYSSHYPWLGSSSSLIKDGLQSELSLMFIKIILKYY